MVARFNMGMGITRQHTYALPLSAVPLTLPQCCPPPETPTPACCPRPSMQPAKSDSKRSSNMFGSGKGNAKGGDVAAWGQDVDGGGAEGPGNSARKLRIISTTNGPSGPLPDSPSAKLRTSKKHLRAHLKQAQPKVCARGKAIDTAMLVNTSVATSTSTNQAINRACMVVKRLCRLACTFAIIHGYDTSHVGLRYWFCPAHTLRSPRGLHPSAYRIPCVDLHSAEEHIKARRNRQHGGRGGC
mgnify:CR=1 FL=1